MNDETTTIRVACLPAHEDAGDLARRLNFTAADLPIRFRVAPVPGSSRLLAESARVEDEADLTELAMDVMAAHIMNGAR